MLMGVGKLAILLGAFCSLSLFAADPPEHTPLPSTAPNEICIVVSKEVVTEALAALSQSNPEHYRIAMKESGVRTEKFGSTGVWDISELKQHIDQIEAFTDASTKEIETFLNSVRAGDTARDAIATETHDIRNLLNPLKMMLMVIRLQAAKEAPASGHFRPSADLIVSVARLRNILEGAMGELKEVSLANFAGDITALAHSSMPAGTPSKFQTSIDGREKIKVNSRKIFDVLANLLSNSNDALKGNEYPLMEFTLSTVEIDPSSPLAPNTHRPDQPPGPGRFLRIEVGDNANGMSPDLMKKIWKGVTTKGQHGTGLGLPSTREIAKEHGGFMEVESVVGVGTKMRLYLPLDKVAPAVAESPKAPAPARSAEKPAAPAKPKPEVLVIDDNRDGAATLSMMVKVAMQKQAAFTLNSKDGLELVKENEQQVILLDLHIGKERAEDTIAAIRAKNPKAKIIIQSGDAENSNDNGVTAKSIGADGWIRKPADLLDITRAVNKAFGE